MLLNTLPAISALVHRSAPAPVDAASPMFAPAPGPASLGMCGCSMEEACTCGDSLTYLRCVLDKCLEGCEECAHRDPTTQCDLLNTRCGTELTFACVGNETSCEGKYHQTRYGATGLKLETEKENAPICGPTGKCIGDLKIVADVHKPEDGAWLECEVPKFAGVTEDETANWQKCSSPISGSTATCSMPLSAEIRAGEPLEGRCHLLDGKGGKRLTKNAWFTINNAHRVASQPKFKRSGAQLMTTTSVGGLAVTALFSALLAGLA